MLDMKKLFRRGVEASDLQQALTLPVASLAGVADDAADALSAAGIATVFDLGSSWIFANAEKAADAGRLHAGTAHPAMIPSDWLKPSATFDSVSELPDLPLVDLRGLTEPQALAMQAALDVATIYDFAYWPPRQAARQLVSHAAGTQVDQEDLAGEALRPRFGEYPTERVYFDKLVMLQMGDPGELRPLDAPVSLLPSIERPGGFGKPAVGVLLQCSQSWSARGVTLGHMLHSLALAPGEATRIAVIDWSRRTSATATEDITETEQLDNSTSHSRAISEVQNAVASEQQHGSSMSSGWAESSSFSRARSGSSGLLGSLVRGSSGASTFQEASTSTFAASASWSVGTRRIAAEMTQNVNDRTEQHANSVRNRRATAVREVAQSEHEAVSTRIVANYNHMHALTVQYYEVVQVYQVNTELHQADRCLFVPFELIDFERGNGLDWMRRFRGALVRGALSDRARDLLINDEPMVLIERSAPTPEPPSPGATLVPGPVTDPPTDPPLGPIHPDADHFEAVARPVIEWERGAVLRIARLIGMPVLMPNQPLQLPADTELVGVSLSGLNIASIRLDRPGTSSAGSLFAVDVGKVDLPPNINLDEVTAISVARAASDSLHAGQITLHCSYRGRPFDLPPITLQLASTTAMQRVVDFRYTSGDRQQELLAHLQANSAHYSQVIFRSLDTAAIVMLLSPFTWNGEPLVDQIEPAPIAAAGNFLVFRAPVADDQLSGIREDGTNQTWEKVLEERGIDFSESDSRLVPVPTGGVFAEAVLGRSNSAEKLDITRFWNWQDSPIPLEPPEIAQVATGSRGAPEDLTPGNLSSPLLNIVNPTSLPDPAGLTASLNALATANLFRDMSGLAGTQNLADSAATGTLAAAGQAGQLASQNLQTEAQKAVAMGQIAADIAKAAMKIPQEGSTDGISADGARINHGRDMDERGSTPTRGGGGGAGGASGSGGMPMGGSTGGGSGGFGATGGRMTSSREGAYADQGALGYAPGGIGALSKLVGEGALQPAVFGKEDSEKVDRLAKFWKNLIRFQVPPDVIASIAMRGMSVQTLESGVGDLAVDSYPVLIAKLPSMDGEQMTPQALIEHIRKNLNDFVDNFWADFLPYSQENPEDPNPEGTVDSLRWLAGDATKTVFDIDIPGDNGAVVCSAHNTTGWIFTTVEAPDPGLHPVSGHRGFEIFEMRPETGVYIFHTMGVDRKSKFAQDFFWAASTSQRKLWTSFQNKVVAFINANGGEAETMEPEIHALHWGLVQIELF